MRQLNLKAKTPGRFKLTADSKHSFPRHPISLTQFDVDVPNKEVWTADIITPEEAQLRDSEQDQEALI
jgi:hypothetical protein